ncbi:DUF2254 domain-containing protein [Porphyrobacter sp. YT40]|uniref:DUF2254 domain-containing protein n=1 Tax=Porphyrobacter sp. YT40 TaxID=2547601 RepID=UPI001142527B|nr:DUF2254 domain-containing protein [Porphyrobacter sp. YT40]QDH35932.1 DUF2254 domain-containing protein [Porphyrobacter sp. YT40]
MTARIRLFWITLRGSYWFYPAALAIAAFALSLTTLHLDRTLNTAWLAEIGVMELAGPDSASDILVLVAGAMLGVASTVFSITIAAVAYASGTYGPRLLNNFMEDRGNKVSLAVFIATFVFCVNVLRTIRHDGAKTTGFGGEVLELSSFVPNLSLLIAYGLIIVSVGTLVYFLHHIPSSIRIHTVLQTIGERLIRDICEVYPEKPSAPAPARDAEGAPITADRTGYVQSISFDALATLAAATATRITLDCRTGDFVHPGMVLARWSDDDAAEGAPFDSAKARDAFVLGGMRTSDQDLRFLIDELVEIGLRALSPGINDPFTAITAMHWLGAATAELGQRDLDRQSGDDENAAEQRVMRRVVTFADYVRRGFGSLRSGVATSPLATMVALETIDNAARVLDDETRRADLRREAALLFEQAKTALVGPDLAMVEARYRAIEAAGA